MAGACPDCGTGLEPGYLIDYGNSDVIRAGTWVEGIPEFARFLGMKVGLKVKDRRQLPIEAHRCRRCGYLKLYARNSG